MHEVLAGTGLFSVQSFAGAEIEPVEGGLTNRSFHVTIDSERFVLRIPGSGTDAYIDRAQEAHNARGAARLGIAPEVIHADPRTGVALSRCIEGGRALDEQAFRDPALLESAVDLLARLHRSDADFRGEMALFPILDRYFRLCRHRPDLLAPLEGPRRRAEGLRRWIEGTREPECPCHIDPAPSNFVLVAGASPRLYLLDWEFSARCEPIWDLAYLSADAALSEAQDEHLLSCYYGGGVGFEREHRFAACKGLAHLLIATWAAVRVADGDEEPGVQRLRSERGAEAERLLGRVSEPARRRAPSPSPLTRHTRNQARGSPLSRE